MNFPCRILFAHETGEVHTHFLELPSWAGPAMLGAGVLVLVVAMVIFLRMMRRESKQTGGNSADLTIDVNTLSAEGPPTSGTQLEFYHVPMRLVLVVLAPVGRGGEIPQKGDLPEVINSIVPNFMNVLNDHQPQFRRWPQQLSSQGFSQVFFQNVPLPGDAGKGTVWCGVAGRFDAGGQPMLAGLVMRAAKPNALGQVAVQQPGQWFDMLRVKG